MAVVAQPKPPAAVLEEPPDEVKQRVRELGAALDEAIPTRALDQNLLIATWNIRHFGGLTEKWETEEGDSPKRNLADVRAIAEILGRFDVVAVQEAREDLKALRHVLKVLGPEWGLILTDVNPPPAGNGERLAFVFDTRRVKPSGLAAELVVPPAERRRRKIRKRALDKQFVRTPYAVSFQSGGQTFILVTLHVIYGKEAEERTPELAGIADWLANWAKRVSDEYHQNLIALGDFNIDREDDPNYRAFTSTGLTPPPELRKFSRTITDKPGEKHFYDQIAWFVEEGEAKLTMGYTGRAGRFEWTKHLLQGVDPDEKSFRISDHYPLWAEFSVRE
jgi:endonuclease/exonuclease/phosphatase family metal-dependent hydrolase